MHLALLQFILYNFVEWHLKSVALLQCWDFETHHKFSKIAADKYFYIQYMNLNNINSTDDFEYQILRYQRPAIAIYLDMNCDHAEYILKKLSELRYFRQHYNYLLYDNTANVTNFRNLFADLNLTVSTELIYAIPHSQGNNISTYTLYDVYNNGRIQGGKLNMTLDRMISCTILECQVSSYLSELHLRSKYANRDKLRDVTLRLATVVTKRSITAPAHEIIEFLQSINEKRIDNIARLGFQTVNTLIEYLGCNVSYKFYSIWSLTEVTGGAIGDLIAELVDFTSTPFLPTPKRLQYTTPLTETNSFRSICLFRTPRNTGIQGDVFLKPFSTTVWILFALLLIMIAIFLWSTFVLENRSMKTYLGYVPSLLSTFLISFGSACIQGSNIIPRSMGGRVAFLLLYVISFIMYNYYTSIVVSSLLGSPVKSNIKTLGQLADSALEVGLEPLPFTFVYLNTSQLAEVRRFVKRKIESKRDPRKVWYPVEYGVQRVRADPGFVFVFEASTGYALIEKLYQPYEICDLNEVLLRSDKSLYTQVHKNSSFKELTRLREVRLQETGIYQRTRRFWVQSRLNCYVNNFLVEVGLEYTAPLFFMLLCAYLLVLLVLLLEIVYKKYVDKKRNQSKGVGQIGKLSAKTATNY